jgi:hypothetical protein
MTVAWLTSMPTFEQLTVDLGRTRERRCSLPNQIANLALH